MGNLQPQPIAELNEAELLFLLTPFISGPSVSKCL